MSSRDFDFGDVQAIGKKYKKVRADFTPDELRGIVHSELVVRTVDALSNRYFGPDDQLLTNPVNASILIHATIGALTNNNFTKEEVMEVLGAVAETYEGLRTSPEFQDMKRREREHEAKHWFARSPEREEGERMARALIDRLVNDVDFGPAN